MADITKKVKILLFILVISFIINLGIGITSMAINSTNDTSYIDGGITDKNVNGDTSSILFGLISVPTFFLPYTSILSLSSLGLPTEIFLFFTVIIGIFESVKLAMYIFIIANFIPTVNV